MILRFKTLLRTALEGTSICILQFLFIFSTEKPTKWKNKANFYKGGGEEEEEEGGRG